MRSKFISDYIIILLQNKYLDEREGDRGNFMVAKILRYEKYAHFIGMFKSRGFIACDIVHVIINLQKAIKDIYQ